MKADRLRMNQEIALIDLQTQAQRFKALQERCVCDRAAFALDPVTSDDEDPQRAFNRTLTNFDGSE
ncbi:hypothetical protein B0A50_00036 [Salinomyces thailandicus]|uniref:Uncharacterized protein n=1 Tax=Salinomyces thailandicus TaxID=706561 RepID=A0A4U0UH62_9PEZI|nr:hypothetical protein B0A50_00036 [Salinomyces thailandica]